MPSGRLGTFLEGLQTLLEPAQVEEAARSPLARQDEPGPLAKELVQKGLLTPFQANLLARGQASELVVGPYRLLERLGEGGMGHVYKAHHKLLKRTVALKIIRKDRLTNPIAVKRFLQELRVAGQLDHPNIITAFDAGSVDNRHYYAMEFVPGVDLAHLVKERGALPVADACDYIRQAALALQHAHERGLVHRDIKPANLLLNKAERSIKLLDLGLARVVSPGEGPEDALTRVGSVIGTPDYLAPEQAVNARNVDIRSDLYSLGCTFYYLLTGLPPFRGTTLAEVLHQHQLETAAPLSTYRGDIPSGLEAIVAKLLAKRPDDRYQTPAELAAALAALRKKKGAAPPPKKRRTGSAVVQTSRRRTTKLKKKQVPVLIPVVALLVLGLAVAAGWWLLKPTAEGTTSSSIAASSPISSSATASQVAVTERKPEPVKVEPPKIVVKEAPKVEPAKVEPPKPSVKKEPVPEPLQVADAHRQLRKTYADELTRSKPAELAALAHQLYQKAEQTKVDLLVRYALFQLAVEVAARAGDFELLLRAIDALDQTYAVDSVALKTKALADASQVQQLPAYFRALTDAVLDVVEEVVTEDNYPAATKLLGIAVAASRRANSPPHQQRAATRSQEVAELAQEYATAQAAAVTLQQNARDADASSVWGRFQACFKGNWGAGLVLLAQGSDDKLKELASRDLTNPSAPAEQLQLGDDWWKLGQLAPGVRQKQLWRRARHWYELAWPQLTGSEKARVDRVLKEIDQLVPKTEAAEKPPTTLVPGLTSPTRLAFDRKMSEGAIAMRSGSYEKAVEAFSEAVRLLPDDGRAQESLKQARYQLHMTRGTHLFNLRRYSEAAKEFEAALEAVPGDPRALASLKEAQSRP